MLLNYLANSTNETEATPSNNFLSSGNQTRKDCLQAVGNPVSGTETTECCPEQNQDYSSCNKQKLREKFPRTYKCWDNMKQRRKKGAIIHKEFEKFQEFLTHVGPCEDSQYTLERIDNSDLEYAPGKVEWRDKYAQNSNKGNNVYLTHEDGRRFTVAQWAAITKQPATTLYKRKAAGWSDMDIITGKHEQLDFSLITNPWPYGKREQWEDLYKKAIINGSGQSRLIFLRDMVRQELSSIRQRMHFLSQDFQKAFLYEYPEDYLDELENERKKLAEIEKRCTYLIEQIDIQAEYKKTRDQRFKNRDKNVTEADFNKYYDELFPRPEYTVNKPPPNP